MNSEKVSDVAFCQGKKHFFIVKPRVRRVVQLNYIAETNLKRKLLRDIMKLRSANCNKKVRRSVHSKKNQGKNQGTVL